MKTSTADDKSGSNDKSGPCTWMDRIRNLFNQFSKFTSVWAGHPFSFCTAIATVVIWAISGPLFGFSDTWQLVINTGTTIVTFLMVFLIQNTQNRDMAATHIKLDELIRALDGAHNSLLDLEELDEIALETIRNRYETLASRARDRLQKGDFDTRCDDVDPELKDDSRGQQH
jgi:low affinity Fe/Cu permease